ncbi:Hypothetical predicted protein [Octopus vulgaris]|uniref:Transmembrane protein n=1 Tax=Octopus vulgaris TaxID=6645 RepID=A0AA36AQP3_OCTVU|nr:Hypothetical predicted protein [Octopus vulgaris]
MGSGCRVAVTNCDGVVVAVVGDDDRGVGGCNGRSVIMFLLYVVVADIDIDVVVVVLGGGVFFIIMIQKTTLVN